MSEQTLNHTIDDDPIVPSDESQSIGTSPGTSVSTPPGTSSYTPTPRGNSSTSMDSSDTSAAGEIQKQVSRDRYGFILSDQSAESMRNSSEKKKLQFLEVERTKKWVKMLANWNNTVTFKGEKLKRRLRKGIPDPVRGEAWRRLARVEDTKMLYPDAFDMKNADQLDEKVREEVERDINRTFPGHDFFISRGGAGQASLRRVLQMYAVFDPEVGYCQGMGFIAAMFLTYMVEEDAFYAMLSLLQRPSFPLRAMYCPGMPGTKKVLAVFAGLGEHYLPRIWNHLTEQGIHHSMYATGWFMTLYSSAFPFDLVTRVFDVLWFEGWKIIYRVALALLKYSEREILSNSFEEIMFHFRQLPISVDYVRLWKIVWEIPLTRAVILEYEGGYVN